MDQSLQLANNMCAQPIYLRNIVEIYERLHMEENLLVYSRIKKRDQKDFVLSHLRRYNKLVIVE